MSNPDNAVRSEWLDNVLALAEPHVPAERRPMFDVFARENSRQLDADDLAERTPEDLLGALLSHWQFGASARDRGRPKVRVFSPAVGRGRLVVAPLGDPDRQRRHAVPGRFDDDGDQPPGPHAAPDRASDLCRASATPQRPARRRSRRAPEAPEAPRESWMHVEVDRLVDAAAARRAGCRHRARAGRRARRGGGLEADAGAPAGSDRRARRTPPAILPQATWPKAAPSCSGWPTTTSPCSATASTTWSARDGEDALRLVPGSGLGVLRETAAEQLSASFAALPPRGARAGRARRCRCWWSPSPTRRSTVHRPGYTDYIGVKRFDDQRRGDRRAPLPRPVHVHGLQRRALPRRRCCAARSRRSPSAPACRRAATRPRRWTTSWRPIRATSCSRSPTTTCYETAMGILALGRAPAAAPVRPARPVRALRLVPGVRAARGLLHRPAAQVPAHPAGRRSTARSAEFNVLLGDIDAGAHPFHGAHHAGPGAGVRPQGARAQAGRGGAPLGRRAARRADRGRRRGRGHRRCSSAGARRFPPDYRERVAGARRGARRAQDCAAVAARRRSAWRCTGRLGAGAGALGFKVYRLGEPLVLSDSLPMLEHMGVRVLAEQSYRIGGRAAAPIVAARLRAAGAAQRARSSSSRWRACSRTPSRACCAARSRTTTSTAWCCCAGLAAEEIVVLRAYAKYLQADRLRAVAGDHRGHAGGAPAHRAHAGRAVQAALRSAPRTTTQAAADAGERDRAGAREGQQPVRGPRAAATAGADPGHAAHQLLAHRRSATRRTGAAPAASSASSSIRPRCPGLPRAEAAVRDLRLLAALRRHPPARRQGGARRAALVGPAGRLPHRGAGPGEGADGEEHRDRAGRLQGRLRAEEGAAADRPRRVHEGRRRLLPGLPARPARPHRQPRRHGQSCRRRRWCASTATIRTWWSPPTRAPPPSPTTPTRSARSTATGWATPSPRAAASGYDHKAMGITARGAWESVKRHFREHGHRHADHGLHRGRHRRHVGRRVRQRHAAVAAHPAGRRVRSSAHLPRPATRTPPATFAERERLFKLPRSSWADYDAKLISDGGGVWARSEKSIPISPQARAALGIDAERLAPTELVTAILKAPVDLLYNGGIGTYVKASAETHAEVGDRANDALARQRPRAALQGGRRRRQPGLHPARAHRGRAGRRAASTPTRSTTRPASTPRTTRSTSRSCSGSPIGRRRAHREAAQCAAARR